jgi:hypothetical protein
MGWGETRQDETRQGKVKQDEARQGETAVCHCRLSLFIISILTIIIITYNKQYTF